MLAELWNLNGVATATAFSPAPTLHSASMTVSRELRQVASSPGLSRIDWRPTCRCQIAASGVGCGDEGELVRLGGDPLLDGAQGTAGSVVVRG